MATDCRSDVAVKPHSIMDPVASRFTIYFRPDGGRITSADRFTGRLASADTGNAENEGADDVFQVKSARNQWRPDFCFTSRPTATTQFGIYSLIGNAFSYRVAPSVRPLASFNIDASSGNQVVDMSDEAQAMADAWKSKYSWSGRSGITQVVNIFGTHTAPGLRTALCGDQIYYVLSNTTDADTRIIFNLFNTDVPRGTALTFLALGEASCGDVAAGVTARQKSADDALRIGELYRIGSCLAVLEQRQSENGEDVFISSSENVPTRGGNGITCVFRVIKQGFIEIVGSSEINPSTTGQVILPPFGRNFLGLYPTTKYSTASNTPQLFRCAIAKITISRPTRCFEVGIRSTLGIRVSSFTNFRDVLSLWWINLKAGDAYDNYSLGDNEKLALTAFQSGSVQLNEERYSFFKILVTRTDVIKGPAEPDYYELRGTKRNDFGLLYNAPQLFGIKGVSGQAIYNSIRFEGYEVGSWSIGFEPVSSWEIRSGQFADGLVLIDSRNPAEASGRYFIQESYVGAPNSPASFVVYWNGTIIGADRGTFALSALEPAYDVGYGWTDSQSMLDDWGKIAEAFAYDGVTTSAANSPEHEVVYVNTITENCLVPNYDDLTIVGLNMSVSTEWTQFSQFSAYVNRGRIIPGIPSQYSTLFPYILKDILLDDRFGLGQIIKPEQIDFFLIGEAAMWCLSRGYFFDGVISEKQNIQQWAADVAATMLLELTEIQGRYALVPSLSFDEIQPIAFFNASNIVEGSFRLEFLEEESVQPIQVSVKWRQERATNNNSSLSLGAFAVERVVVVREADRPDTDPIESFDLSAYCTSFRHAVDFACSVIRIRRIVDHVIRFKTTPEVQAIGADFAVGSYISVAMDYTSYNEFDHGAILGDGTIITGNSGLLREGFFDAYTWDGVNYDEVEINVDANGKADVTGVVFARKTSSSQTRVYRVTSIQISSDGTVDVEASFSPIDRDTYKLLMTEKWTTYRTDANWVILVDDRTQCSGGSGGLGSTPGAGGE